MTVAELGVALGLPGSITVIVSSLAAKGYLRHPGAEGGPIVLLRDKREQLIPVPADN